MLVRAQLPTSSLSRERTKTGCLYTRVIGHLWSRPCRHGTQALLESDSTFRDGSVLPESRGHCGNAVPFERVLFPVDPPSSLGDPGIFVLAVSGFPELLHILTLHVGVYNNFAPRPLQTTFAYIPHEKNWSILTKCCLRAVFPVRISRPAALPGDTYAHYTWGGWSPDDSSQGLYLPSCPHRTFRLSSPER